MMAPVSAMSRVFPVTLQGGSEWSMRASELPGYFGEWVETLFDDEIYCGWRHFSAIRKQSKPPQVTENSHQKTSVVASSSETSPKRDK
jgi:hypothetical protein